MNAVKWVIAGLAIAGAAACSRSEAPARAAAAALPVCADAPPDEGGCRIVLDEGEFLVARAVDGGVSLDLWTADGVHADVIHESAAEAPRGPHLQDLDNLKPSEVLVPLALGNVNTVKSIWRRVADAPRFVRLGEVSAIELLVSQDGLLAAPSRSSASTYEVAFLKLGETALEPVATVELQYGEAGGQPVCTLREAPGAAALGLDTAAAQTKFCSDEKVLGLN